MKTIYAIAMTAAVLISATAGAGTTVTRSSTNCRPSTYGPPTCTTTTTKNDDADQGSSSSTPKQKSTAEARREQQEVDARDRRWEAFCRPTGVVDKFGVTRLQYAHQGCEFGISEDIESFAQMR